MWKGLKVVWLVAVLSFLAGIPQQTKSEGHGITDPDQTEQPMELTVCPEVSVLSFLAGISQQTKSEGHGITDPDQTEQPMKLTVCPEGPPECPFSRIQDAINALPDGATILVGPGTYTENLFILHSVKLLGSGADKTIIRSFSTIEGRPVIFACGEPCTSNPIELTIEGFTIAGAPKKGGAIYVIGGQVSLRKNVIRDSLGTAIALDKTLFTCIEDNLLLGTGEWFGEDVIRITHSMGVMILGNKIQDYFDGMTIDDSREVFLEGNTLQNISFISMSISGSEEVSVINNGIIGSGWTAISLTDSKVIVRGNTIEGVKANGISVSRSEVDILANVIQGNKKTGIMVYDEGQMSLSKVSLEANLIKENHWYGVWINPVEVIVVCRLNKAQGNKKGDYAIGPLYPLPEPSEELRRRCEGAG